MSDFFDSEIVRESLQDINDLQTELYSQLGDFSALDSEDRVEHIDKLTELLEKQKLMYTRLSLSDDPKAKDLKKQLEQSVMVMGFPPGTSIQVLFDGMQSTIDHLKKKC